MPAGAGAAAAVPQTTPVALASPQYQRWAQQASFEELADVGGLAAPPPTLGTTSERRTDADNGGEEPSRDVVPEPRERGAAGPGVGYLPAGSDAAAPAPQTTPRAKEGVLVAWGRVRPCRAGFGVAGRIGEPRRPSPLAVIRIEVQRRRIWIPTAPVPTKLAPSRSH
jgi:hypothetical protein